MMKKLLLSIFVLLIIVIGFLFYVQSALNTSIGQEATGKSWFLTKLESTISSPDMKINISNIEGLLSSEIAIRDLSIADKNGIWLKLHNVKMDWSRLALLSAHVSIDTLKAERIDVVRKPLPSTTAKKDAKTKSGVTFPPQLPVSVSVNQLNVPYIDFGQDLFGVASQVSLMGNFAMEGQKLQANADVNRLDAEGKISLRAAVSDKPAKDNLFVKITEPQDGIVVNLLKIEERPALDLTINGGGSWNALDATLALNANDTRVLDGNFGLKSQNQNVVLALALNGPVAQLAPEKLRPILGSETHVTLNGALTQDSTKGYQFFVLDGLKFNGGAQLTASGQLGLDGKMLDVKAELDVADMAVAHPLAKGPLHVNATARGQNGVINLDAQAKLDNALISGRPLKNTLVNFQTTLDQTQTSNLQIEGKIGAQGSFNNEELALQADFADNKNGRQLNNFTLSLGDIRLGGALRLTPNMLVEGNLQVNAPDIESLAALALMQGKGSIKANIALSEENGKQQANIVANAKGIKLNNGEKTLAEMSALDARLVLNDVFGAIMADGVVKADNIIASGYAIHTVDAKATTQGNGTRLDAIANIQNNIQATVAGVMTPTPSGGWNMQFDQLKVSQNGLNAQITQPATINITSSTIAISNLDMAVNNGRLTANGVIADNLGIDIKLDQLPLAIANLVKPDLGIEGTVSGSVSAKGTKTNPNIAFNLDGENLGATMLKEKGVGGLHLTTKGSTQSDKLNVNANLSGSGLDIGVSGLVPFDQSAMDVRVDMKNLPVALANGFVENQNLAGMIQGNAHITGTIKNPSAQFNLNGQGLSAAALAQNGLAPLQLKADGGFSNNVLSLNAVEVNGPQALNITAHGTLPISGNNIDLNVRGSAPLAIANKFVAERGAQISGTASVDATIRGSLKQPQLGGSFAVSNGNLIDAETNLRLNNITVAGTLNGERIVLNSVNANSSAGGSIAASGYISTDIAAGMPADITVNLNNTRYSDGEMVVATVNGQVTVTGALMRDPVIGGDVTIIKAEITVPDHFGGASQIDIKHKNLTKPIQTTLDRAKIETRPSGVPVPANRPSVPQLKMRIRAPNQIFVRGMGLDVELGGEIGLIGPVTDIHPVGGFQMRRGRFDILSKRLDFSEGQVTLVGNLNPEVNFVATSESSDITVTVTVSGTIDNLSIVFSSQPELPQDEVLARLIFNRSISELSPFQIAQLASAAAELAGITNTSLMGALRANTGLDDLDVVTDAQGNTGVRAGRYIRDNIYLGVEAGSGGSTKGTVNLDISKNMKAKGALGAEGDSSVGVFYEKDY